VKGLIVVILLAAAGYFAYQKYIGGPPLAGILRGLPDLQTAGTQVS
jgi:hypothetical protein